MPTSIAVKILTRTAVLALVLSLRCSISAQAAFDPTSHVFVILMENHNWSSIKGSTDAPYINNALLPMASYCDQYYNPSGLHPSEPNYLWLEAGTNFGVTNDGLPTDNHQISPAHLVTQLKNAGISWKTYQENIDGLSCPVTDNTPYVVHHNPFAYFDDVVNSAAPACVAVMRPISELATDLANNTVAQYNFITPGVCSDMHDSCAPTSNPVRQGDDWLAANLPVILNSNAYQNNGLVIITWDEGENGGDGPIGCIVLSPLAKGAGYHGPIRYTHSATLRTIQKIFGVGPFLGSAASGTDLADLFVSGAIPNADPPPTVVTTSASNVNGGNATLEGMITPNGDATSNWFQYGLTTGYGTDTLARGSDDAESYSGWAYGNNGGSGFGPAEYIEGTGGGLFISSASSNGRQIDGAKSFGVFAGATSGNTQGMGRSITNAQAAGVLTLSVRFDVSNAVGFSGINLKSAKGTAWGGTNGSELISFGLRPANGSTVIAINGAAQTINLGSEIRGQVIDFLLTYDTTAGTYQLGAKFRAGTTFITTTGPLKIVGQPATYVGFGNFNGGAANQNLIFDSMSIVGSQSAGNGNAPVLKQYNLSGLTPNTTYHYRAVAQNSRGTMFGADQTFGFPLVPPNGSVYHSTDSVSGSYQARIYDASGHIAIAQPDLNGNPLANVLTLTPPSARINGNLYNFGSVQSVTNIPNGLELVQSLAGTTITTRLTFSSEGIMHYEVTNWNGLSPTETDISAGSDSTEHFYGFGEKFNALDQAGNKVHIITSDIGGDKNDSSYKASSWFMSNRGYGFHLDSTAESFFDMRNGAADRYTVQNLFGTLKFNLVAGPKLTDVLSRYTSIVGRPYLPPPWVFGTWVSSDIWRTGGEVRYAITKHLATGIPISVFVYDSPWEVSYNDFVWNMSQWGQGGSYEGTFYNGFTSVTDMMTFLQQNGVKVVCWFTPFLNTSSFNDCGSGCTPGQNTGKSPNYDFAAANNYFVRSSPNGPPLSVGWWKGTGSPIDFTNPDAANWFKTTQLQPLVDGSKVVTANSSLEPAIGGFKTDDGEAVNSNPATPYIPSSAVYSNGKTGLEMQNGYAVEYHKTVSSVLGSNGILFARSGFNGTGAFPAGWPGDNQPNYSQTNGLQSVITAGDSAAMSGFSIWGHDIGAYQNANFTSNHADLFMRWAQYGAFTPIMQMHRGVQAGSLTDTNNLEQYPWGYGNTALANYVAYSKLHSQLFPYIYTYAKQASTDGLPLIRPMVLLNQTDPALLGVQHTFYFGNELLVAPMNTATSTSRNIQLPAGNWYDYWTNAKYAGGQNLVWTNADTTKIPLLVREGSIIPMLPTAPQTLCDANYVNNPSITTMDTALQFLVYPGASAATFTMYDNTTANCAVVSTVTTLNLSSIARPITFKVFETASPAGVERNGLRLPHLLTLNDFNNATTGWFYESAAKFLYVKFRHDGGSATVSFGPDSVGDGVTDSWRQFYGVTDDTADSDADGLTNAQEYFAGTNPNDPESGLVINNVTSAMDGTFMVNWPSQNGIVYRVQWKNALTDATWQSIAPDFTGDGSIMDWNDDGSQTGGLSLQRFYRVEVP